MLSRCCLPCPGVRSSTLCRYGRLPGRTSCPVARSAATGSSRRLRPARPPGPVPSYPDRTGRNSTETQDVVVYPPPRYEIVGLLQQCSYAPVNERRPIRHRPDPRTACSEGVREGLQIIAGRERPRAGARSARPAQPPALTTVPVWPPRTPVTIAVDAGTTGVRALVVDERGRVVDLAYRELTQHFPRPGPGGARRRRDLAARARHVRRGGRAARRRRSGGPVDRHHQPARDGGRLGPVHRAPPSTGRSSGRTAAPPTGARPSPTPATSRSSASGPAWSSTRTSRARRCSGCSEEGGVPAGPDLALATVDSWVLWNLTGGTDGRGVRHRRHQRLADHALRHRRAPVVRRAVRPVQRARRRAGRGAPVAAAASARWRRRCSAAVVARWPACPSAPWSATSTPPCSARPASTGA